MATPARPITTASPKACTPPWQGQRKGGDGESRGDEWEREGGKARGKARGKGSRKGKGKGEAGQAREKEGDRALPLQHCQPNSLQLVGLLYPVKITVFALSVNTSRTAMTIQWANANDEAMLLFHHPFLQYARTGLQGGEGGRGRRRNKRENEGPPLSAPAGLPAHRATHLNEGQIGEACQRMCMVSTQGGEGGGSGGGCKREA